MLPPLPLFVDPTVMLMEPAWPLVAKPTAMTMPPAKPLFAVPVENSNVPLEPAATAFALRMVTAPDDDDVPAPLTMLTAPPTKFADVVSPANKAKLPPLLLFDEPTVTLMLPAAPLFDVPVEIRT